MLSILLSQDSKSGSWRSYCKTASGFSLWLKLSIARDYFLSLYDRESFRWKLFAGFIRV